MERRAFRPGPGGPEGPPLQMAGGAGGNARRIMATERHVRHFQDELEHLKARLLEMGGLAEERVRLAVRGLGDAWAWIRRRRT